MEDINRTLFLKETAKFLKHFYEPEARYQLKDFDFFLIHFIMQSRGEIAQIEPCKYNEAMTVFFKYIDDFMLMADDGGEDFEYFLERYKAYLCGEGVQMQEFVSQHIKTQLAEYSLSMCKSNRMNTESSNGS